MMKTHLCVALKWQLQKGVEIEARGHGAAEVAELGAGPRSSGACDQLEGASFAV